MAKKQDLETNNEVQALDDNKKMQAEFELSDGTKCVMKRCKAVVIIRSRKMAIDEEMFYPHLIAATTTFDGKKLTANDILEFDADDYVLIEYYAKELVAPKNLLQQEM